MIHLYLDDWRACPEGFALARNGEECLMMLRECEVGILSLDYELGPDPMNGGDVTAALIREKLYPKEIFLHTSSPWGRKRMYEMLYEHMPAEVKVHNGPMPEHYLSQFNNRNQHRT
ncbi:cyclic-phosphate processing receiver domain-containing protein [Paenibacillus lemnae]|uniref:Cell division protein FtsJ n=1 Tax=Paenibacillus lemnae TaxID=1330551 RepID=A0A848M6X0_PAELE|nr:cyclic-phosphate processing receiver domain-containing protein [Paenibacillus lemnae]NMO95961.1 cell division protein FtsJ [Paenibacillus lemnae]